MKTRRLAGIAALSVAAASILAIPGASAQEAGYSVSSDGQALALSLFGESLTAGLTQSHAASSAEGIDGPLAVATGTGLADPLVGQSAAAEPDTALPEGITETEGEQCGGALPEEFAQLGLAAEFACSSSTAAVTDGSPTSAADAHVSALVLNPVGTILETPLSEVVEGVEQEAVEPLLEGLAPLFQGIDEGTGLTTEDTLNDLFALLLNGAPLATISAGGTQSDTTTTADQVVTQCVAQGARIDVLDPAGVDVEGVEADAPPVLSVIVGGATTSVSVDRATAEATADATPAIATVIAPVLGPENAEIAIGPGDTQVIPLPDPFGNIVISVAGTLEEEVDNGTSVHASAVRIHLFEGSEELMNGVELALADCFSVGSAAVQPLPSPEATTTTTAPPPTLPRTGDSGPNGLAIAAAAAFAGLGFTLLRRSRTT